MQALFGRHAFGRDRRGALARRAARPSQIFDETLQRIRAAVEDQVLGQFAFLRQSISAYGVTWAGLTMAISRPACTQ